MADDDARWDSQTVTDAKLNALAFFSYTNLAAFPATNMEIGAKGLAEDTGIIYQNQGTYATPIWTLIMQGGKEESPVYPHSSTKADYTGVAPSSATATSSGSLTAGADENMSTDNGTQQGTVFNVTSGSIDGACDRQNSTNHTYTLDVQTLLGEAVDSTKWVCDFDINFDSIGLSTGYGCLTGIVMTDLASGASNTSQSSQDSMGFMFADQTGDDKMKAVGSNAAALFTSTTATATSISATTFYIRMIRNSDVITIEIYSDSARTSLTSTTDNTQTGVSGLRYWKIYNFYNAVGTWNGTSTFTVDNFKFWNGVTAVTTSAASVIVDDLTAWTSTSESAPAIYVDEGSAKDAAAMMINLNRTDTTVTEITIRASTDATFTSAENVRTITVSDLTDDTDYFYRFNRLSANKRYFQVIGTGTGILSLNKIFMLTPTDWDRLHKHKDISTSDTSIDGEGL